MLIEGFSVRRQRFLYIVCTRQSFQLKQVPHDGLIVDSALIAWYQSEPAVSNTIMPSLKGWEHIIAAQMRRSNVYRLLPSLQSVRHSFDGVGRSDLPCGHPSLTWSSKGHTLDFSFKQ